MHDSSAHCHEHNVVVSSLVYNLQGFKIFLKKLVTLLKPQFPLIWDHTRSLAEAYLEYFSYGFICQPQVWFNIVDFNKSLFPHLQLAPSGFN